MAEGIAARVQPASPARPLTAYTGAFGERTVRMEDGKLYYRFGERPRRTMIPVGGDAFTLENDPALRIHFIPSGDSITAIEVVATPGRPPQGRYERTE